jgi:DNA-binding protein H-NS
MAIDDSVLNGLSIPELKDLIPRIEREIRNRKEQQKVELLEQMKKMAAAQGLSLTDVLGNQAAATRGRRRAAAPAGAKSGFRHPNDASLVWTGRGRRPKWVVEWERQHGSLEGLPRS